MADWLDAAAKANDTVSGDRSWGLRTSTWFSHSSLLLFVFTKLTNALVLRTMLWSISSGSSGLELTTRDADLLQATENDFSFCHHLGIEKNLMRQDQKHHRIKRMK